MDLDEELLAHPRIRRRLFLGKQLVQARVAVENDIVADGGKLVAGEQDGVIRVVAKIEDKLDDVVPARHGSRGRRCLSPPGQEEAIERSAGIVLDIELDADLPEVALNDRLNISAPVFEIRRRRVLELQALPAPGTHSIGAFHPAVVT